MKNNSMVREIAGFSAVARYPGPPATELASAGVDMPSAYPRADAVNRLRVTAPRAATARPAVHRVAPWEAGHAIATIIT